MNPEPIILNHPSGACCSAHLWGGRIHAPATSWLAFEPEQLPRSWTDASGPSQRVPTRSYALRDLTGLGFTLQPFPDDCRFIVN